MARRQGLFDDLVAIAAKVPWWVAVLLAAASYASLHYLASGTSAAPATPKAIGDIVVLQMGRVLAGIMQYILPIAFFAGALVSVLGRRKRNALYGRAVNAGATEILRMSWREFEMLISEAFRRRGFQVVERGGRGADGGVDLVLAKGGERHVVQCKHWRATSVPVSVVRELFGAMAAEGAVSGFVVTAGEFTRDARDFAKGRNVELIGGATLMALLQDARETLEPGLANSAVAASHNAAPRANDNNTTPMCPKCGRPMVMRTARQGTNAGNAFWGCSGFPGCRGIRATI
jgi:restriction system protein